MTTKQQLQLRFENLSGLRSFAIEHVEGCSSEPARPSPKLVLAGQPLPILRTGMCRCKHFEGWRMA